MANTALCIASYAEELHVKIVHRVQHKKGKKLKYRKKATLSPSTNTPYSSINLTSIK